MRVRVDNERCQGHARCIAAAPELFELDEDGYSHEVGDGVVPAGREDAARLAMLNCPERAVLLIDDETGTVTDG